MALTRLKCIDCGKVHPWRGPIRCDCGGLLETVLSLKPLGATRKLFDARLGKPSGPHAGGVWRFKELINPEFPDRRIVTRREGNTGCYQHALLSLYVGVRDLWAKHEGENPTGSFKDRGMTVGVSEARRRGARIVACASTGNTSASMAAYAAMAGLKAVVFIPAGKVAHGKLSQALAYGARVLEIDGNFDEAMTLVQEAASKLGIFLLNSVNPWRIQGQKTIVYELVQQMGWEAPDWIVLPAGNLGNTAAFGAALADCAALGLIDKLPRIATIQAQGAAPFHRMIEEGRKAPSPLAAPETLASAIRIGNPVSWKRAAATIRATNGTTESVSDAQIMDAKALVDSCGIGCEPASAASVAGARKLVDRGMIRGNERVVMILTGHLLKDPGLTVDYHAGKLDGIRAERANRPIRIKPHLTDVERAIEGL